MENQNTNNPVSAEALALRQRVAWDNVIAELLADPNSEQSQIDYCMQQIARIEQQYPETARRPGRNPESL